MLLLLVASKIVGQIAEFFLFLFALESRLNVDYAQKRCGTYIQQVRLTRDS